jgi:hypothetical protein
MKTTKPALENNKLNTSRPFIIGLAVAILIAALFIHVTSRIDTGIDCAMMNQATYSIHFG